MFTKLLQMANLSKTNKSKKNPELSLLGINEDLKDSYKQITNNVEIIVWPEFISNQKSQLGDLFIWAYHIKITNKGDSVIKLLNRHWKIIDEQGTIQEVDGEGVVGEKPTILPSESFQYSSGVHLKLPSGIMTGHYQMQNATGEFFDVKIPAFSLDSPSVKAVIN